MSPTPPANAKKPTDHQAKKNEANPDEAKEITFTYEDVEYTVSMESADDLEILEALEADKYIEVLRRILGLVQWNTYKETKRKTNSRVTTEGLDEFLTATMEALEAGNSDASPTS